MISIVVIGEKDHGKSTLLGRLLYETKSLPEDRIKEIKKVSQKLGKRFELAHLLDSFRYERDKEMTLDTTCAFIKLDKDLYEFIDVPGHEELIKNMLSGASRAEYGILVLDACEGIKPQTIRHLKLARFLGIKKIIAVINKLDKVGYSSREFLARKKEVVRMVQTIGFRKTLVLPTDAFRGENLIKKYGKLAWFKGPTLVEAILKNFKPLSRTTKTKIKAFSIVGRVTARCVFVKRPSAKNLILESHFGESPVQHLKPKNPRLNEPLRFTLNISKKIIPDEKFVLKKRGEIIALCTTKNARIAPPCNPCDYM